MLPNQKEANIINTMAIQRTNYDRYTFTYII